MVSAWVMIICRAYLGPLVITQTDNCVSAIELPFVVGCVNILVYQA